MNPIRALRASPFAPYLSDCVAQRYDPLAGRMGLYCVKRALPAETLVACLPVFACVSPSTVASSAAGQRLAERLPLEGYSAMAGIGKMTVSRDSMLVAAFTAMSMNRGPLKEYLANIGTEGDQRALREDLRALGKGSSACGDGDALVAKYDAVQSASLGILKAVFRDVTGRDATEEEVAAALQPQQAESIGEKVGETSSLQQEGAADPFTFAQLCRAHALCESRVLAVPTDLDGTGGEDEGGKEGEEEVVDVLGGPALIPWLDLVNHSDTPSNVAAAVMRTDTDLLPPALSQIAPLCVVAATRRDVAVGEELTYEYMEALAPAERAALSKEAYEQRLLLWATRFHFIPAHMR